MQRRAKRATEISSNMSHTRPDGKECFTVLKEMNISYNYAGENIGGGYSSPEAVVKGWMNSEGHRDNILDPYFTKWASDIMKSLIRSISITGLSFYTGLVTERLNDFNY